MLSLKDLLFTGWWIVRGKTSCSSAIFFILFPIYKKKSHSNVHICIRKAHIQIEVVLLIEIWINIYSSFLTTWNITLNWNDFALVLVVLNFEYEVWNCCSRDKSTDVYFVCVFVEHMSYKKLYIWTCVSKNHMLGFRVCIFIVEWPWAWLLGGITGLSGFSQILYLNL